MTLFLSKASRGTALAFFFLFGVLGSTSQAQTTRLNQIQSDINYLGQLIAELQAAVRTEQGARAGLTNIEGRLGGLENEIRTLTATVEQLQFQLTSERQQGERQRAALKFRIQELEQRATSGSRSPVNAASTDPSGFTVVTTEPRLEVATTASVVLPSAILPADGFDPYRAAGLLEESEIEARTGPSVEQYRAAYQLYQQANFAEAEAAFRAFLVDHPTDDLIANASYWLGETYYARGDFTRAAIQFADGYRKYADSAKGGDHLLKLALSLAETGRTNEACGSLALLLSKYDQGAAPLVNQARDQAQALGCR